MGIVRIIMQVGLYLKLEHKQLESWVYAFLFFVRFPSSAKYTSIRNVTLSLPLTLVLHTLSHTHTYPKHLFKLFDWMMNNQLITVPLLHCFKVHIVQTKKAQQKHTELILLSTLPFNNTVNNTERVHASEQNGAGEVLSDKFLVPLD